ncbi:MAG: hypothetical protein LBU15_04135 [Rickettsiales bacterium]|jgi:hypothetical protein|nr:hypothetical protein [Rickettsiales bacterium]
MFYNDKKPPGEEFLLSQKHKKAHTIAGPLKKIKEKNKKQTLSLSFTGDDTRYLRKCQGTLKNQYIFRSLDRTIINICTNFSEDQPWTGLI